MTPVVFVAGGDIGGGSSSDAVDVYDGSGWTALPQGLSVPRTGVAATCAGNQYFLFFLLFF